jgi:transposase
LTHHSDATRVLRQLGRTRKQLVEARVGMVNQLSALLEIAFPGTTHNPELHGGAIRLAAA